MIEYLLNTREFVVVRKHGILAIGKGLGFEETWVDNLS